MDNNKVLTNSENRVENKENVKKNAGSVFVGFLLGIFYGLGGIIIAKAIDKYKTIEGAISGFIINFIITLYLFLIAYEKYLYYMDLIKNMIN